MENGCFTLRDKEGNTEKYPLFDRKLARYRSKAETLFLQVLLMLAFSGE
jgi:hypothetical protein